MRKDQQPATLTKRSHLGSGTADSQGSVCQTCPRRLVDVSVTWNSADAQTSQDLLQAQHDLIATLRLREEEKGDLTASYHMPVNSTQKCRQRGDISKLTSGSDNIDRVTEDSKHQPTC